MLITAIMLASLSPLPAEAERAPQRDPAPIRLPPAPFRGYRQIETHHFVFVYEPQDVESARRLASFAEQVYDRLTRFFRSKPEHITCLLIGRTDAANGYFNPLPPHHIGLYLASPDTPAIGARSEDWLRLLFIHELTHYVHLVYERGFFHALSRLFGPTAASGDGAFLPGWAVEGTAVTTETLFSNGGRGRNPYFELYYRALLLEQRMFGLGEAGYDSYGRPEGRVYIAGYLIIDYIVRHFGEEAFYRIHDDFVRFPFVGMEAAVHRVTGSTIPEIWASVLDELRQRYADASLLPVGALMSPAHEGDFYLPVPAGGALYEYRDLPDRRPAIVRVDPQTRRATTVVEVRLTDPSSFSITSDGSIIAFSAYSVDATVAGGPETVSDLYLFDTANRRTIRLTNNAHLTQPAIAPDGSRIVALQRIGTHRRLVSITLRGTSADAGLRLLYSDRNTDLFNPTFSPDGTTLAFVRNRDGRQTVAIAKIDNLAPLELSADRAVALQPDIDWNGSVPREAAAVHPGEEYYPSFDGNHRVIFTGDADSRLALYTVDIDSGETRRLLTDRVGAARGIRYAGGVLYESYAHAGATVRFQSGGDLTSTPVAAADTGGADRWEGVTATLPAKTDQTGVPDGGPERSYANGAPPDFWLPYPTFTRSAARPLDVGPALLTYGSNVTGTFSWTAYAGFYPALLQPAGGFQLSVVRGPFSFGYSLSQYYGIDASSYESLDTPVQNTTQRVDLTLTPLASLVLGTSRVLSFSVGMSYAVDRTAPRDFTFAEGFDPAVTTGSQALIARAGVAYRRLGPDAPLALYPAGLLYASLSGRSLLPALGQTWQGVHLQTGLSLSAAFPTPLQSVSLSLSTSYDTGRIPSYRSIVPPGFTSLAQAGSRLDTPGIAMALLRYGFTIASTDLPIPFYSGLVAVGASLFAAYTVGFDPGNSAFGSSTSGRARFVGDDRAAAGFDFVFMLARNTVKIPLRFGAAVRFDPSFTSGVSFPEDFGFTLSFGGYPLLPSANGPPLPGREFPSPPERPQ